MSADVIAVLAGGTSCEREVSLVSGRAVYEALVALGRRVVLVDPIGDFVSELRRERVGVVFIALHGTFGEDGTVQRILEKEGFSYTGPGPEASEKAFDKEKTQQTLRAKGVRIADFAVFKDSASALKGAPFPFPIVVKPTKAGSSVGVSILKDSDSYAKAVSLAFQFSDAILVERFVPGRELTVGFLGDEPLPIVEVIAQREFYDYEAKYGNAGTRYQFPAELTETERLAVTEEAVKAYRALGCEVMSRVDLILGPSGQPTVLEVNTIPGLTPKSLLPKAAQAAGITFPELCVKILDLSLSKTKAVP